MVRLASGSDGIGYPISRLALADIVSVSASGTKCQIKAFLRLIFIDLETDTDSMVRLASVPIPAPIQW